MYWWLLYSHLLVPGLRHGLKLHGSGSGAVNEKKYERNKSKYNNNGLLYKYWLLMRGMVENYCPRGEIQPLPILFTEARRAEVNSRQRLNFTEGTITFYHSPNKRAVNICFKHPIHRFFSSYRTVKSATLAIEFQIRQLWQLLRESGKIVKTNTHGLVSKTWTFSKIIHVMWRSFNQSDDLNLWMGCIIRNNLHCRTYPASLPTMHFFSFIFPSVLGLSSATWVFSKTIDNLHISHNASGMGPIYGYF